MAVESVKSPKRWFGSKTYKIYNRKESVLFWDLNRVHFFCIFKHTNVGLQDMQRTQNVGLYEKETSKIYLICIRNNCIIYLLIIRKEAKVTAICSRIPSDVVTVLIQLLRLVALARDVSDPCTWHSTNRICCKSACWKIVFTIFFYSFSD